MNERHLPEGLRMAGRIAYPAGGGKLYRFAAAAMLGALIPGAAAAAQVITIDTSGKGPVAATGPVDRRYSQIEPTNIPLPNTPLDRRGQLMLVRYLQSEQGFAMRPFPRGRKGLTLDANGKLNPAGEAYLNMVTQFGISSNPGDRLVITNVKIERSKIILDFNGGPDPKHRFLRHIQIGMDPTMTAPVVQDAGQQPTGSRLTLKFHGDIPNLTGSQVEDLLAPLISFKVKTPIQAFTDTLPAPLKKAILDHQVLVGMTTEMVRFAMGDPVNKYREVDNLMPVTIWMYGKPPQTVTFVRINGNRVIRVEIARVGQPLEVFTKDVVTPMMMENGTPVMTAETVHPIQEGDVHRNPDTQAPAPPPTLRAPGEKLPPGSQTSGTYGPVYFPPDTQDSGSGPSTTLGQNPDIQPPAQAPAPAKTESAPAGGSQQTAPANKDSDAGPSTTLGQNPDVQPPAPPKSQPQ